MIKTLTEKFNPLLFLASLGAGGIAVSAFIFIQYGGLFSGQGLATLADVTQTPLTISLEIIMVIFSIIHMVLSVLFFISYAQWKKTEAYQTLLNDPLSHSSLMAPIVSLAMSMNIVIAVIRYFSEMMSSHFQDLFLPAFIAYVLLWLWGVSTSIKLMKKSLTVEFDTTKIHFGWLLQPFALSMIMVTGSGFAALAKNTDTISYNTDIAAMSAFLVTIIGTMTAFLFVTKMVTIFQNHFHRDDVLDNHFKPTYLIVIPILTLFGISAYRLGHYLNHVFHAPILFTLAKLIVFALFAFQVWYFAFGLSMMRGYWKGYLLKNFHISQWGLVCPFVAFVALGLFFANSFFLNTYFISFLMAVFAFVIGLFFFLLKRQIANIWKS